MERWEFPPKTRVGSLTCMEPDCSNEFVVDGRERKRMLEAGFKTPKRCQACRRSGKISRYRLRFSIPPKVKKPGSGGGGGGGGGGGAGGDGFVSNPNDAKENKKRSAAAPLRWKKTKKSKAKSQRSQPKAGMLCATMAMMAAACR